MRLGAFRVLVPTVLLLLGPGARTAFGQTGVSNSSPFVPPDGAVKGGSTSTSGELEFIAVVGTGAKTTVGLFNPATKKSVWIPVGGEVGGVTVRSYDARGDQIVIRVAGAEKVLFLRKEAAIKNGAAVVTAPIVTATKSNPMPVANGAASPPPAPTAAIAAGVPTATTPAGAKPPGPPVPPEIAKKQEEARRLTSDLLEIGLEQRQAYEAARRRESEQARTSPPPANPAPAH